MGVEVMAGLAEVFINEGIFIAGKVVGKISKKPLPFICIEFKYPASSGSTTEYFQTSYFTRTDSHGQFSQQISNVTFSEDDAVTVHSYTAGGSVPSSTYTIKINESKIVEISLTAPDPDPSQQHLSCFYRSSFYFMELCNQSALEEHYCKLPHNSSNVTDESQQCFAPDLNLNFAERERHINRENFTDKTEHSSFMSCLAFKSELLQDISNDSDLHNYHKSTKWMECDEPIDLTPCDLNYRKLYSFLLGMNCKELANNSQSYWTKSSKNCENCSTGYQSYISDGNKDNSKYFLLNNSVTDQNCKNCVAHLQAALYRTVDLASISNRWNHIIAYPFSYKINFFSSSIIQINSVQFIFGSDESSFVLYISVILAVLYLFICQNLAGDLISLIGSKKSNCAILKNEKQYTIEQIGVNDEDRIHKIMTMLEYTEKVVISNKYKI